MKNKKTEKLALAIEKKTGDQYSGLRGWAMFDDSSAYMCDGFRLVIFDEECDLSPVHRMENPMVDGRKLYESNTTATERLKRLQCPAEKELKEFITREKKEKKLTKHEVIYDFGNSLPKLWAEDLMDLVQAVDKNDTLILEYTDKNRPVRFSCKSFHGIICTLPRY